MYSRARIKFNHEKRAGLITLLSCLWVWGLCVSNDILSLVFIQYMHIVFYLGFGVIHTTTQTGLVNVVC